MRGFMFLVVAASLSHTVKESLHPHRDGKAPEMKSRVEIQMVPGGIDAHNGGFVLRLEPDGDFYSNAARVSLDRLLQHKSMGDTETTRFIHVRIADEKKTSLATLTASLAKLKAVASSSSKKETVIYVYFDGLRGEKPK